MHFEVDFQYPTLLNAPSHDGSAPCNAEHILHRQLEGLVQGTFGNWDICVHCLHELEDGILPQVGLLPLEGTQCRPLDDGDLVTLKPDG